MHVGAYHALPVSVELSEESRGWQRGGGRLLGAQVSQMVMSTDPLYRAPLLLLLQQRVRAEVRGLVQRRRVGFVQASHGEVLGHRLLQVFHGGACTVGGRRSILHASALRAGRAEHLVAPRDGVVRRGRAQGVIPLVTRDLRRRVLLVLLLLVRAAVVLVDLPLATP